MKRMSIAALFYIFSLYFFFPIEGALFGQKYWVSSTEVLNSNPKVVKSTSACNFMYFMVHGGVYTSIICAREQIYIIKNKNIKKYKII